MVQRSEGHFTGAGRNDLFMQAWTPDQVRGIFVISHGLAEHSECYHPLAKTLSEDGWQVFAWDLRGHGRSEGKRGFVLNIANFIDDYAYFLDHIQKLAKSSADNMVLFGHSMGGLITTRYLETHPVKYGALALSSPAFGLTMPVPKLKETLANIAIKYLPTLTMFNEIKYTDLTHDPEMIRSYQKDNLRHDKISPGLFLTMVENFPLALAQTEPLQNPTLFQVAGQDRLVSAEASRRLFDQLSNKKNQFILYPESFHEVFNDLDREKAIQDLKKFINPYLGA